MPIFRLPTGEAPPTWKCVQLLGQIQFQYSRLKDCNTPASKCSSILTLALTSPASNALYGPLLLPQVKPSFIATKVVSILSLFIKLALTDRFWIEHALTRSVEWRIAQVIQLKFLILIAVQEWAHSLTFLYEWRSRWNMYVHIGKW